MEELLAVANKGVDRRGVELDLEAFAVASLYLKRRCSRNRTGLSWFRRDIAQHQKF
jgi:hypothetical protein